MEISPQSVVALTWTLKDSLADTLDELQEPVEFLVGGDDLLPAISAALQGHEAGATLDLNLEPEDAFGDFDEELVFLAKRDQLPDGLEEGMLLDAAALPADIASEAPSDAMVGLKFMVKSLVVSLSVIFASAVSVSFGCPSA